VTRPKRESTSPEQVHEAEPTSAPLGHAEQMQAALRKAGIKLTHQRSVICHEIASSPDHPDAETVFRAVRRLIPTASLDTVYRTLWLLEGLGLVTTFGPRRGGVRFEPNLTRHHHYVCVRCGGVRDFVSAELDSLPTPAELARFGSIETVQVEVRGVCDRCAQGGTTVASPSTTRSPPAEPREEGT